MSKFFLKLLKYLLKFIDDLPIIGAARKFAEKNFSEFKDNLSQLIVDKIEPISIEIKKLLNEKSYLDKVLFDGSKKANFQASNKVKKIHEIIGF